MGEIMNSINAFSFTHFLFKTLSYVKKLSITVILATFVMASAAQDSTGTSHAKTNDKKEAHRQKISNLIRQAEHDAALGSHTSFF